MKRVLIGHRGVGKSTLLKRHQEYFPDVLHFDLDLEVEKSVGLSIDDVFKNYGEAYFRKQELETVEKLFRAHPNFVISLGAGFDIGQLPKDIQKIFVSRVTDQDGRIFLNRPRLNADVDPQAEYQQKYSIRQKQFLQYSDFIYHLPEGVETSNEIEQQILQNNFFISDGIYTLTANDIPQLSRIKKVFLQIELRSDLIPMRLISEIIHQDPQFQWLLSIRTEEVPTVSVRTDFDIHIPSRPADFLENPQNVISCHEESLDVAIAMIEKLGTKTHIKLSPVVENFADLLKGHLWQQQQPQQRSFLPRSATGKWVWFRQLSKYFQKINFVRNQTDIADQPSIYQWLLLPASKPNTFAAVVGNPVLFSRSPEKHREFFREKKTFFTAIQLSEADFNEAFDWLIALGLKYVAVTSPLKKNAFYKSTQSTNLSQQFQTANTLLIEGPQIFAENTDAEGFKSLIHLAEIKPNDSIAVWGGGGTLAMMKSVVPQAHFYSSRAPMLNQTQPDVVIWSTPRTEQTQWPPENWNPRLIVDLNYRENSMGLEYAQKKKCSYISGLGMFNAQAMSQQKYWSQK
ncbi:MAG: hypothetical protein A2622_03800 [Bdellovibrionales bacterium RIFCSPHIGHO2_01_FULL_40_29]|nr:MAG: hypothetical protein A2622_03800 [Bdellovibrionales bacterium RIFCSPHIGHO2_01_FULL_40_29]OFZ35359.1 MAG: hypothetical protein A3D17_08230 [Bdellovibrionales bacterium RIFCSPHIGHO2_02_FULL_40_15]